MPQKQEKEAQGAIPSHRLKAVGFLVDYYEIGGHNMENQMNNIISQLSHIEDTAVRIMQSADAQKKKLASEMEHKTKEFDEALSLETNKKLNDLKEQLNQEKEKELSTLRSQTQAALEQFESKYQQNHSKWAEEIFQSIVGA